MPDTTFVFQSVLSNTITSSSFWLCTVASLALGIVIALLYMLRNQYTKSFVVTLTLLPAIVQVVIMLVNGNLGTGVAVMGAFSLVRFRSVPGSAREIGSLFLAMAVGLATGMGYIGIAILTTLMLSGLGVLLTVTPFGEGKKAEKELKITIPEDLDYTGLFDDLFAEFAAKVRLTRVKTTHMGSLYQLTYRLVLKDSRREKELIDAIRCRNGNLEIVCGRDMGLKDEL